MILAYVGIFDCSRGDLRFATWRSLRSDKRQKSTACVGVTYEDGALVL